MKFRYIAYIIYLLCFKIADAQTQNPATWMLAIEGGYGSTAGNWSSRFGTFTTLSGGIFYKTSNNWYFGPELRFSFTQDIGENPFKNIQNKDGNIIGEDGQIVEARVFGRAYQMPGLRVGKMIKLVSFDEGVINFHITGSSGYIWHKLNFENINSSQTFTQIRSPYDKGYDRLSYGWAFNESIGVSFHSNYSLLNLMISYEATQAITQSNRYNFDLMARDKAKKTDLLNTIKLTWLLPLRRKKADDYYYY